MDLPVNAYDCTLILLACPPNSLSFPTPPLLNGPFSSSSHCPSWHITVCIYVSKYVRIHAYIHKVKSRSWNENKYDILSSP